MEKPTELPYHKCVGGTSNWEIESLKEKAPEAFYFPNLLLILSESILQPILFDGSEMWGLTFLDTIPPGTKTPTVLHACIMHT